MNNSWAGTGADTFYQATVDAWVASGIFPQFSNGSSGPSCGTVGAPGSYVNAYAAGAYDINNNIASFSSRGPSPFGGEIKPNIAAPGVNIRSSVPTAPGLPAACTATISRPRNSRPRLPQDKSERTAGSFRGILLQGSDRIAFWDCGHRPR